MLESGILVLLFELFKLKDNLNVCSGWQVCILKLCFFPHSPGAWVITGGTNAGVMKHVGDAVEKYGYLSEGQAVTIGIFFSQLSIM